MRIFCDQLEERFSCITRFFLVGLIVDYIIYRNKSARCDYTDTPRVPVYRDFEESREILSARL